MPKKDQQEDISWEEEVSRFLSENPDFFTDHPQLLADISLSHPDTGTAISLIERQVGVLRDQNRNLDRNMRELVSNARENDVISQRLHDFAKRLLRADSLSLVFGSALSFLQETFNLDAASIRIAYKGESAESHPEIVTEDNEQFMQLLLLLADGKTVCGSFLDQSQKDFLFTGDEVDIKSCALVSINADKVKGILCLGSQDSHRFEESMATDYLARLGELAAVAIERQILKL
ncbi:MAG: DUF484 family protein [Acidiferrobacterales bacterium]